MLEALWEYDHIALCLIGMLAARRDPELSFVAGIYAAIIVLFSVWAKSPSAYGHAWYAICAGIELAILVGLRGAANNAGRIVLAISAINMAAHLAFYFRLWTDKDWYSSLILTGEYSQAACIIILSPPSVAIGRYVAYRWQRWSTRRKDHTWLARTSIG